MILRALLAALLLSLPGSGAAAAGDALALGDGELRLNVPAGLELATESADFPEDASPLCAEPFDYCLYPEASGVEGSNFRSAGLRITRREDIWASTSCLLAQPAGWSALQPAVHQAGNHATSRFGDLREGAAGSFSNGELRRLFFGESCWEFETRVITSRFENYEPGTVEEFTDEDAAQLEDLFGSALESVTLEGEPVVWPATGSSALTEFVRFTPPPGSVSSPFVVEGEAVGYWFFEASFPLRLLAGDGSVIAEGYVVAQDEWMTEEFVPFRGELVFEVDGPTEAVLELQRQNASDLRVHDAAVRYPVTLR